jgi:hypothetical protein
MRTLRALRPLRAMSRMQGMRVCTQQSQGTLEEHVDLTYQSAIGHHVRIEPLHFLLIVAFFSYFSLEVNGWISKLVGMRQHFYGIQLFCLYMYTSTCQRCNLFDFAVLIAI